jgi:hypothetical protein
MILHGIIGPGFPGHQAQGAQDHYEREDGNTYEYGPANNGHGVCQRRWAFHALWQRLMVKGIIMFLVA